MADSSSTENVKAAIAEVQARLAEKAGSTFPNAADALFLEMLGRNDESVQTQLAILASQPTSSATLNALALICLDAGNRKVGSILLSGAVLHGPNYAVPHANLAYVYLLEGFLEPARILYEHALWLDPKLAIAHHGLADVLGRQGDAILAQRHRSLGMRNHPVTFHPYRGTRRPVRLLALGSATSGNIATAAYFDETLFSVASLVVEYYDRAVPLPEHDIVFNIIGDADLCAAPLAHAAAIAQQTAAPVINKPAFVIATNRVANAERLGVLDNVMTPRMTLLSRTLLSSSRAYSVLANLGFTYPLLVRSPGYHGGEHFTKVDRAADLPAATAPLPGDELLVIQYIDVRNESNDARKYRVIVVDGTLYPLHVAISSRWKVHYFSADMAHRTEHRLEDAAFLTKMDAVLGRRAIAALRQIAGVLALDYAGIDFALDAAGGVIVFEANATMTVPLPEPAAMWDYRREPVALIHTAVHRMLIERAAIVAAH